jgi:hypothetical protein
MHGSYFQKILHIANKSLNRLPFTDRNVGSIQTNELFGHSEEKVVVEWLLLELERVVDDELEMVHAVGVANHTLFDVAEELLLDGNGSLVVDTLPELLYLEVDGVLLV